MFSNALLRSLRLPFEIRLETLAAREESERRTDEQGSFPPVFVGHICLVGVQVFSPTRILYRFFFSYIGSFARHEDILARCDPLVW